ncbi:MAG: IS256 family transposase [Planctomycetota bacterium]|jgi:transposase-like protein
MTKEIVPHQADIAQVLQGPEGDFLRSAVERLLRQLMEEEVARRAGAERYERSEERSTYRNGYRPRLWETRVGPVMLEIPRLREGSYLPSFLEPRRRAERALVSVVQEAYVSGVSTRSVDDLVRALGGSGIDKSAVSRMCKELDEEAEAFRNRPLEGEVPYVWLDAVYEKVREGGRVQSMAVVLATGVTAEGVRTILGLDVGNTESRAFWTDFLRCLVRRGLSGSQLVISDAHEGLRQAIAKVLPGAGWQRCRVHTMRSILTHVSKSQQAMVLAAIKTIFVQPSAEEAHKQLKDVVKAVKKKAPKAAELLEAAADDVLAYMAFPREHWQQIHSTNPLERLIKEIRRRTRVVGIFPNRASVLRLVTMLLAEQDDEWQAAERAYFSQTSMAKVASSVSAPPGLMKESATG